MFKGSNNVSNLKTQLTDPVTQSSDTSKVVSNWGSIPYKVFFLDFKVSCRWVNNKLDLNYFDTWEASLIEFHAIVNFYAPFNVIFDTFVALSNAC